MQLRGHLPQVIHNDDRSAQIRRQTFEKADVGIQPSGRTTDVNDGKLPFCCLGSVIQTDCLCEP